MIARVVLAIAFTIASSHAITAETIRVVASELPPCVFAGEELSGFSVELWEALADELEFDYELNLLTFDEKLDAIRSRSADVAIGCISVSADRERDMDFTHAITTNGFTTASLIEASLIPNFSDESLKMLLLLLLFVIFFAHLMWWSEHGQSSISDRYFPGVFQSIWFSLVTMSTVGYGDIAPQRWLGRISAALLILTGVTAFGVIFGQFAADALGQRAAKPVAATSDLRTYVVGTKAHTATAEYLGELGVETIEYADLESAADAIRTGSVDVIMHDTLAINHLVQRSDDLVITGPTFSPHYLGIALQESSPLRESLNAALLKIQADGRYQTIHHRWF
ncbi:MAG: transporter substrate-binding domain-containing protein [Gammaproteobacteria bacterium]|nr:transporter substrate-binding domain-containing protein [Gammaproteobacteria bacterium]